MKNVESSANKLKDEKELSLEEYVQKNRPVINLFIMITIASLMTITISAAHIIRNTFGF